MNVEEEKRLSIISHDAMTFFQDHENNISPELVENKMHGYMICICSLFGKNSEEYKLCLNLFKEIL